MKRLFFLISIKGGVKGMSRIGIRERMVKTAILLTGVVTIGFSVSGCGALLELTMVGAGKSATIEDTGFFQNYDGLAAATDADKKAYRNLPDLYYISPNINIKNYKKVIVPDFTSRSADISKIAGLQSKYYKTIRKDLADNIAETFNGSAFEKMIRISEKVDPKDIAAIMKLSADAVLMGNIKELAAPLADEGGGAALAGVQIEYKIIDRKTGKEVLKAIHRSTTDKDKVATAQIRVLSELLNKARNTQ